MKNLEMYINFFSKSFRFENSAKVYGVLEQEVSMHQDCQSFYKLGSQQSNLFLYIALISFFRHV